MRIIAGIRSIPAKALPAMPLTDTQIRNAKPTERQFKLSDGGWLFLGGRQVCPSLRSPQRPADAPRAAGCQLSGRPVPRQKRRHVDDERVAA